MIVACSDNNKTVDASLYCFTSDGILHNNCMQIGFTQNSFIFNCGNEFENSKTCGTFLEIHKPNGSPYDTEDTILAEVQVTDYFTNGMRTMIIPLTYKNDSSRLLCSIVENKIRIGSMVTITASSYECCCPKLLTPQNKTGSFMCPRKSRTKQGPFADPVITIQDQLEYSKQLKTFPICPPIKDGNDVLFCSFNILDASPDLRTNTFFANGRYISKPCNKIQKLTDEDQTKFSSEHLDGMYDKECSYGDTFQAF